MAVNITADQIVNSNNEAFSFFFTDLQEGQGLVFNLENNRWENAFIESADAATTSSATSSATSWAATAPAEAGMVPSELYDATFYGMNSLYFDGTNRLTWTPRQVGNLKTWTWSGWVKRNRTGTDYIMGARADNANTAKPTFFFGFRADLMRVIDTDPRTVIVDAAGVIRDTSAWHHYTIVYNTYESVDVQRIKIYKDGVLQSYTNAQSTQVYPGSEVDITAFNSQIEHSIGMTHYQGGTEDGQFRLANIQFIDGMALDAGYFGQNIEGNWAPKKYEGSYGANGFWLDFNQVEFDENTGDLVTVKDVAPLEGAHTTANDWSAA